MNGNNAVEALQNNDFKVFYPENNGREGMFVNIQAFFIWLFGAGKPWVLRLVSSIFGILTVVGIFFAVREFLKGKKYADLIALLSSFFVSISFWHINFSRIGFRAIMAPFFLIWSFYVLGIIFNKLKEKKEDIKYLYIILLSALSGFIYGLGMHSYIAYRATPLLVMAMFLIFWKMFNIKFSDIIKTFSIFVLFSLIAFAPLGIYFFNNPQDFMGRTSQVSIFNSGSPLITLLENTGKTLMMFNIKGDGNWRHNYANKPQLEWLVGIFFLIGLISEILLIFKNRLIEKIIEDKKSKERTFLVISSLLWIVIGILPVVLSSEGLPHALRAILIIPPVYIISALGAMNVFKYLYRKIPRKILSYSIFLLSALLIMCSYCCYFIAWGNNSNLEGAFSERYAEIGKEISKISSEIPKYIVVNAGGVLVRDIPMPAQTVMFISNSFTKEDQEKNNVHYILPDGETAIPNGKSTVFYMEMNEKQK